MPYRKTPFASDEYFHLVNRGNLKCNIFRDDADRARFLFYILHFQSILSSENISRYVKRFLKTGDFGFDQEGTREILNNRMVQLIAFALMDNHFHLIVQAVTDKGVSAYMQKILRAFTSRSFSSGPYQRQ